MSTSEEKLRQLLQDKLGNLESPVDPGIWSGIQSGLNAATGSTGAGAGIVKAAWLKIAGIATGVIAVGVVAVTMVKTESEIPAEAADQSPITQFQDQVSENTTTSDLSSESETSNTTLYTTPEVIESPVVSDKPDADHLSGRELDREIEVEAVAIKDPEHLIPNEGINPEKVQPSAQTTYAEEIVSAGFSFVNSPGMGLEYLFIPEYTRAPGYNWYINEELFSNSLSPSYEFARAGEYSIRLSVLDSQGQIITELSREICIGGDPKWKIDANYFTPNGDGFSDIFDPTSQSENIIVLGLFIYNSQNQLIFSKTDGDIIWDGSDSAGNPMPDGQYMYRISGKDFCDGKVDDKTGTMALRR